MRARLTRVAHNIKRSRDCRAGTTTDEAGISLGLRGDWRIGAVRCRLYRILQNLNNGKFLYVDDLVTRTEGKRNGFAGRLFDWLLEQAREQGCSALVLDSGVQRFEAHRFYLQHRMDIAAHHFVRRI
jgi:GNAT superfamily N-acetyltransferase